MLNSIDQFPSMVFSTSARLNPGITTCAGGVEAEQHLVLVIA
ncbi:MAG TPA: hypothetical protein VFO19_23295 [Vicinamibacterales bacterium]|nr:hypothetical protein [Vicinamibacterales bacterium]